MERIPVSSSNLCSVGYDYDSQTLEIEFLGGGLYEYYYVPEEIFEGLMNAYSKGSFFYANIRNTYQCGKLLSPRKIHHAV